MASTSGIGLAVWVDHTPRTLVSGTPSAPTNRAEQYAKAIWEYATRTLTGTPGTTYEEGISLSATVSTTGNNLATLLATAALTANLTTTNGLLISGVDSITLASTVNASDTGNIAIVPSVSLPANVTSTVSNNTNAVNGIQLSVQQSYDTASIAIVSNSIALAVAANFIPNTFNTWLEEISLQATVDTSNSALPNFAESVALNINTAVTGHVDVFKEALIALGLTVDSAFAAIAPRVYEEALVLAVRTRLLSYTRLPPAVIHAILERLTTSGMINPNLTTASIADPNITVPKPIGETLK